MKPTRTPVAIGATVQLALLFSVLISRGAAQAGEAAAPPAPVASIEISGALPRRGVLTLPELKKLGVTKAAWKSHGEQHEVTGVGLDKLLAKFGFEPGPMGKDVPKEEKRRGWRKVVVVSARDGYAAVSSCAEVFQDMGATRALVVWEIDGKPLSPDRGPLRLVVLTDKEPSRSIHGLTRLEIVDLTGKAPR